MPLLPVVSIIGRPNVGKSSLFNRILGRKAAIVDDMPGVTRDRNYAQASWNGRDFMLVDTGGLVPSSHSGLVGEINQQVDAALVESGVIVFVVEAQGGPSELDMRIARRLRGEAGGRLILAVNKSESNAAKSDVSSHFSLGCGEPMAISALHGSGVADLLDRVCEILRTHEKGKVSTQEPDICISVVGRPNAGKSLFVNKLLGHNRMIVDGTPGTTRDAIDSVFRYNGRLVKLIDTAGLRRKSQVVEDLEYYTNVRALSSIERAHVCMLMIDATLDVATQDLKILEKIIEGRRGAVVCLNKWDLVAKTHKTFDHLVAEIRERFSETRYLPFVAISALEGQRVWQALDTAIAVKNRMANYIKPAQAREMFAGWTRTHPHPLVKNRPVRLMGMRQIKAQFPLFEVFCTQPQLVLESYRRYLANKMYETEDFLGCPLVFSFKRVGHSRRR